MSATLRIPALAGGGLVLSYRCSSRCRHCLYACGPHRRDGEPTDQGALEALLDSLAARAPNARYHIGGGEPFLDVDRLERAIAGLRARGLTLEYVETNAAWVRDEPQAQETLERLARVGLGCVLVSLSPFHAEFVPLAKTRALIRAAERALPGGALVWISQFAADLAVAGEDRLALDALLEERGDSYARGLAERYGLIPAGRAGRYLVAHGGGRPWQEVAAAAPCRLRLADTSHFHVDCDGLYVPGLCAGLVLPIEEVPGEVKLKRYPLLQLLLERGPAGLVELARAHGFEPEPSGYSAACDLCTEVRRFLWRAGERSAELGPSGFYDSRSFA